MFYNARWYDPALGRFAQADSIVPPGVQGLDRYAYVNNSPMNYVDPSGHFTCDTVTNQYAQSECEDWSPENEDYDPCEFNKLACNEELDYSNITKRISRPISGIHWGFAGNVGIAAENYAYTQWDILFDYSSGVFYGTTTIGNGGYLGTPNGVGGEFYVGTSDVNGIPGNLNSDEVANLIDGDNLDIAIELGPDAGAEVSGSMGVSLDINPATGQFQETTAGQMYTVEKSVVGGLSPIPTTLDAGVEIGVSHTDTRILGRIPFWIALLP